MPASLRCLPQLDKQEHMYHTTHKPLSAARHRENEQTAQNGSKWHK